MVQQIASVWGLSVAKLTTYQIKWGESAGGSAGNSKTKPAQVVDASNQAGSSDTKPAQSDGGNQAGSSNTKPAQSDGDDDDQVANAPKTLSTGWIISLGISAIAVGLNLAWAGS